MDACVYSAHCHERGYIWRLRRYGNCYDKTGCLGHERIVNFRRDGYLEITDNASNPQNTVNPIKLRGKFRKNDNYYLLHEKNKYVPDLILPRRCFQDDGDFTGLALILRGNGMDEP